MTEVAVCWKTGKRRLTRRQALSQAHWWRRWKFTRMTHYRCKACGSWHIGNDLQRRPKRVAQ